MNSWVSTIGWIGLGMACVGALAFIVSSLCEKRLRAVRVAFLLFTPLLVLFAGLLVFDFPGKQWLLLGLVLVGSVIVVLITLPAGPNPRLKMKSSQERVDERDALFHRFYTLKPGMAEYDAYYRDHPEKVEFDQKVRAMPELGYPGSKSYHPRVSPFFVSAFDALRRVTLDVEWKSETETSESVQASSEEFTMRIKGYARYLGADIVGTTRLNPAYVYSHNARSQGKWGEPVNLNHSHAIVVGIEMDHEMIRHAPDPIATTETALKYFEAAKVAMLVAAYIRRLGYEARPHVDGNYRVMCVPVAVDAGLGELGRLGLLITPEFGPRVRLSVVTTNLPLLQDAPIVFGVQDFCDFCKKCATNCPSGSIDRGSKKVIRGVEKWQSEQDSCYRFWRRQGSDCSICVKVCPYSHSNTAVHNWVRWTIRRNRLARRLALWGDDLFYGRRPKETVPLPDWHSKIS